MVADREVNSDRKDISKSVLVSLFLSFFAMSPIWASGLSGRRAVLYLLLFGSLIFTLGFTKYRTSTPLAVLIAVVFGCILLSVERASFVHYPIRIIIVVWQALIMLIACNQKLRKVVLINLVVFCVLFLFLEIPFRLLTSSQSSSQFQYIELFRNSRSDGPGSLSQPATNTDSEGLRITTDQPPDPRGRVLIFGGSTTFCGEVTDDLTSSSFLQRRLNQRGSNIIVENHGLSAATSTDRVVALKNVKNLSSGDIVIFYIGVNEAGMGFNQRDKPVSFITKVPEIGNALQKISRYSRIADVLFRSLVFGGVNATDSSKQSALIRFEDSINEAQSTADKAGAHFIAILQPNLFTRVPRSDYDSELGTMYGVNLENVVIEMYTQMLPIVQKIKLHGDATTILNALEPSPYYDWMHVDSRGNDLIATFLEKLLVEKQLVN